jgi:hypothetical protein
VSTLIAPAGSKRSVDTIQNQQRLFRIRFAVHPGTGSAEVLNLSTWFHGKLYSTPFRKSRKLHNTPAAAAAAPRIFLAPSLRFAPNRSRDAAKASFTNIRLPITTPSVK